MSDLKDIAAALAAAQGEMKNAPLNRVNPHFKSKYADLSAIRDAVVPALSKHGIAVVHTIEHAGDYLTMRTRLIHASGQYVESTYPIAIDKPQVMGSAITYAKRYSLAALCCISADEDDDGNAANAGEAKPITAHAAKTEINWPEIEKAIRSADTERKLNAMRSRIEARVGIWPASYVEQARELVEQQMSVISSAAIAAEHMKAIADAPDAGALDRAWTVAERERETGVITAEDWQEIEAQYHERMGGFAAE